MALGTLLPSLSLLRLKKIPGNADFFVGGPADDFPIFSVLLSLARRGWEEVMYGGGRESHPKERVLRPWRSNNLV